MKKFFSISIVLFLITEIKAQSLEETKSWILSKLNTYKEVLTFPQSKPCDAYPEWLNFYSKFEQDTLVISCDVKNFFPDCFKGDKNERKKRLSKKVVAKIPIADISSFDNYIANYYDTYKISIYTDLETIRVISTSEFGETNEFFTKQTPIGINLGTEELLFERLKKAFEHLVTFYPKKKKKEVF